MPNPATAMAPNGAQTPQGQAPALPMQPFVRASQEHVEPLSIDVSFVVGAQVLLGNFDVNSHGFLRSILVRASATGGTGTAAIYKEDAPYSAFSEIALTDTNGAPLVGPITGYELYLIHKWGGGLAAFSDPTRNPSYVAPATSGNFDFTLRIPVEISSRDGLGALPNQNAAATYKLRLTQAVSTDIYSTPPTGFPTMRTRAWGEFWSPAPPTNMDGAPNAQVPPCVGTGSFWSKQIFTINNGQTTVRSTRMGNMIRSQILIYRTTAPARSSANFPDPIQLYMDSRMLLNQGRDIQPGYMAERQPSALIDTGVVVFDQSHDWDGLIGGEMRDQWVPTTGATRYEYQGGAWGAAGTLTILTNDVAPKGNIYMGG